MKKQLLILPLLLAWCLSGLAAPSVVDSNISCANVGAIISTTVNSNTGSNLFLMTAVIALTATINSVTHNGDAATFTGTTVSELGEALKVFTRVAPGCRVRLDGSRQPLRHAVSLHSRSS